MTDGRWITDTQWNKENLQVGDICRLIYGDNPIQIMGINLSYNRPLEYRYIKNRRHNEDFCRYEEVVYLRKPTSEEKAVCVALMLEENL